jgi:hypothetical protein
MPAAVDMQVAVADMPVAANAVAAVVDVANQ